MNQSTNQTLNPSAAVGIPLPVLSVPEERADAAISFPTYATSELPARRAALLVIPNAFGRKSRGINTAWSLFTEQWLVPVAAQAALMERRGDEGTVARKRELIAAQTKTVRIIEEHKFNALFASTEYVDGKLGDIFHMITKETEQVELNRLTTKKIEVVCTKGAEILFVVPQLIMFSKATHIDPARSIPFGIFLGVLAFCLPHGYQLIARPIMECLATLTGKPAERFGEAPLKTAGVAIHLALFGLGFIGVLSCVALLDATVIFQASQLDVFGQKNPSALSFPIALAIAGTFSGMLGLASLVIARLDRERADIVRMVQEKIGTMVRAAASTTEKLRRLESELVLEREREAEVFASAKFQWIRLLTAVYLMSTNAPDDGIIRYLMMPYSPFDPTTVAAGAGGNVTNVTPRAGFGTRLRGLCGRVSMAQK